MKLKNLKGFFLEFGREKTKNASAFRNLQRGGKSEFRYSPAIYNDYI